MRQVNVVGPSPLSQPSRVIQTLQAPPDVAPGSVTVRTASETSLWMRWVVSHRVVMGGCQRPRRGGGPQLSDAIFFLAFGIRSDGKMISFFRILGNLRLTLSALLIT